MENQHRLIKSHRELSAEEIALMNEGKALESSVLAFIDRLEEKGKAGDVEIYGRWLAIGKTGIEQGFMAVIRAIAKPGQ
ncbi:hypothetical protein CYR55_22400 [Chimaeribacter californicus]|uniref:Acb2/Tad1 hairpin domain-containing protein n=1 Tax=Chimaeribacter californicus TaxID=2060067 RepID=A0A2N5DTZ6_9GAMM|nr:hypothetical protein [Chimaeribacter californicus]PLR30182.1 hypothetical protein CYR55_22400 [Chimaeribacter californicus]